MQKRQLAVVLAAGLFVGSTPTVDAQKTVKPASKPAPAIELKGLSIGMTEEQVAVASREHGLFTIGGARPKYDHMDVSLKYREGRLDRLFFFFAPENFESVADAVRSKYPALKCVNSKAMNRMGAEFAQVECTLKQAGAHLSLTRLAGDIETSSLTLLSDAYLLEQAEAAKKKSSDI